MIKVNGHKVSARIASLEMILDAMETLCCQLGQKEFAQNMTDKEFSEFMRFYTREYNRFAVRLEKDRVKPEQLINDELAKRLVI